MILVLSGKAGAGKDEVAGLLYREFEFERIALADPIKEFTMGAFGFTYEQLWGPSELRNEGVPRWNRGTAEAPDYLTPREALQVIGTEVGRRLHPEVWIRYAWEKATRCVSAVITDARFPNEIAYFAARGAKLIRIVRPGLEALEGASGEHASETEQDAVPDSTFDVVITNDKDLASLHRDVRQTLALLAVGEPEAGSCGAEVDPIAAATAGGILIGEPKS